MTEALHVTPVPIEALIPAARNSRTHSAEQVAQIAGSIREFGFTNPVLIDGARGIIAGHGRVLAARKLGLAEVPCIELGHLSETQKRAYILADNKLALNAGWDLEMLRVELEELQAADFDVSLAGFDAEDLATLLAGVAEETDETDETEGGTGRGVLSDKFGYAPFSVLNAREGWWQDRKRAWLGLGIKSEIGRGGGATWGDSPEVTETGLNYYRNRRANAIPGGSSGANSVYTGASKWSGNRGGQRG